MWRNDIKCKQMFMFSLKKNSTQRVKTDPCKRVEWSRNRITNDVTCIDYVIPYRQSNMVLQKFLIKHEAIIKWNHFPRYWPFVRGIPLTKTSDVELRCFLWSAPEQRLSKQLWGWWFETPLRQLWRHCNEIQHGFSLTFPGEHKLN